MTEPEMFSRMRQLDDTEKYSYCERGALLLQVKKSMVHQERIDPDTGEPCSFSRWIRLSSPWGYATAWAALRDVEELSDIPMKDLMTIPQGNIGVLRQLSTAVRKEPNVLALAKVSRPEEFTGYIKSQFPLQHVESKVTLRFVADETQAAEIEEAITLAMEHGAMNRTEALVALSVNYRADLLLEELQRTEK